MKRNWWKSVVLFVAVAVCYAIFESREDQTVPNIPTVPSDNAAYVAVNNNEPAFTESDLTTTAYEYYSELDLLGRCGYAMACVGQEIMPDEERGSIGQVKPTGWHTVKYDFVDGKYLYNRCHLLGYQLTGENANNKNLITGTRYMNVQGMLPFENMVADYVKETGNHVIYRVTPLFEGDNLVATGVQMEALSVEDSGDGICFNVFVYNIEPGVTIDYVTGVSCETDKLETENPQTYVLDYNNKLFHKDKCTKQNNIAAPRNYVGGRDELFNHGYKACSKCKP